MFSCGRSLNETVTAGVRSSGPESTVYLEGELAPVTLLSPLAALGLSGDDDDNVVAVCASETRRVLHRQRHAHSMASCMHNIGRPV